VNTRLRLNAVLERLRSSLWTLPSAAVIGGLVLGSVLVNVELPENFPGAGLTFGGGPEGARQLLTAIASAMITVTGTVFSITVVVLQLASSQYSPRLLRNFLRHRGTQVTLGLFLGTFAYALAVLRVIRAAAEESGREEVVPSLAVTVAVVLVLAAVGALVFFIHHITQAIRVETLVRDVARDTEQVIDRLYPDEVGAEVPGPPLPDPPSTAVVVTAPRSGHVQAFDSDRLLRVAERHDLVVRIDATAGDYVVESTTVGFVWTQGGGRPNLDDRELRRLVASGMHIGNERTMQQDASFGIRQLTDIAVKALSTGLNDPNTAMQVLGPLSSVLVRLIGRRQLHDLRTDADGHVRVGIPRPSFRDHLALAVDPILHYAGDEPFVMRRLCGLLDDLAGAAPTEARREEVRTMIDRVLEHVEQRIDDETHLRRIRADAGHARAASHGEEQPNEEDEDV
jgi:uncharacterized membrane protein